MKLLTYGSLAALGLPCLVSALPSAHDKRYVEEDDGVTYNVFEHRDTATKMSYVTNSGICETTPGVNQYSGYLSVGSNMNMWFWFFEARSKPTDAPLAMWLNGGPGCSSMIGLFQENGPCHFKDSSSSSPTLNPYSFNTYANMLYVDQPIGTGFSYGTESATSTVTAAEYVWKLLQAFYTAFPDYKNRDFGLFTESYGGHYGPEFAYYFETQNAAIDAGKISGEKINLIALGINNGLIDPQIQYKAYADFAYKNTYKQLISKSDYNDYIDNYNNVCLPAIEQCKGTTGDDSDCLEAYNQCGQDIEYAIMDSGDFDVYDVREPSNDPYPNENYVSYLQSSKVMKAIGAKQTYQECPNGPGDRLINTGDEARSFLGPLSSVVQSGVSVLIWAGDADFICNWMGNYDVVNAIDYDQAEAFGKASIQSFTVGGKKYGEFKGAGNLSWLKVYGAGHEVPYYQPEAALQAFTQTMQGKGLKAT